MITNEQARKLYENLVCFTCDKVSENWEGREKDIQSLSWVYLFCGVIVQAIKDLDSKNQEIKNTAQQYFDSSICERHCEFIGLSQPLLELIISNPNKWLKNMKDYYDEPIVSEAFND